MENELTAWALTVALQVLLHYLAMSFYPNKGVLNDPPSSICVPILELARSAFQAPFVRGTLLKISFLICEQPMVFVSIPHASNSPIVGLHARATQSQKRIFEFTFSPHHVQANLWRVERSHLSHVSAKTRARFFDAVKVSAF